MFANTDQLAGRKRAMSERERDDGSESGAVRRRISRACDQCNQLRSKCDGKQPCAHCLRNSIRCAYERASKKRGRAPKQDQNQNEDIQGTADQSDRAPGDHELLPNRTQPMSSTSTASAQIGSMPVFAPDSLHNGAQYAENSQSPYYNGLAMPNNQITGAANEMIDVNVFPQTNMMAFPTGNSAPYGPANFDMQGYGFPLGDDSSVAFMGRAPMVESPDWLALTSPMFTVAQKPTPPQLQESVRFPVLQPVLPYLQAIMPPELACELLEEYFASPTLAYLWPKNPYVLGYIFRKQSILHPTAPRSCSPALLASMLWISAQHSDAPFLTIQPDARAQTCQRLLELTMNMLKPLMYAYEPILSAPSDPAGMKPTGIGLSGSAGQTDFASNNAKSKTQIDNIVTYIHLATVASASERKAASLRWWNAAWSLAREIRLGRELPVDTVADGQVHEQQVSNGRFEVHDKAAPLENASGAPQNLSQLGVSEEDREERRRSWWLLYMMDRHLALCYNRPTFFLNKECEGLLEPMDDNAWQLGDFANANGKMRRKGLAIECSSLSVFGFFLPIMVILGEILDLNHARNRPRFGPSANKPKDFSESVEEIEQQLATFEQSLHKFEALHASPSVEPHLVNDDYNRSELGLRTKMITAYSTHIMHVLHILLTGKWDPIALLDDNDLWISTQSFVNATSHAVSAAKALADIIEYDPDLSCMPYFFGIYLLQGSFLLLLFADKLQGDIDLDVVRGCEVIVRAHEACVSTLENQYQRNFRRVMRSALQQLRGRFNENATEQQNWRREILKLYRWTGDGTGLAL